MKELTKLNITRSIVFIIIGVMAAIKSEGDVGFIFGILSWVFIFGFLSTLVPSAEQLDS